MGIAVIESIDNCTTGQTMETHAVDSAEFVTDAVSQFLHSPPEGTPAEVLQAFVDLPGGGVLPPRVFLRAVEQAPVAISITDTSANILYVNESFEELTGYRREDAIGKNQSILSSDATPERVYKGLWKTLEQGKVWRGSLVNNRKDGSEYVADIMISPVQGDSGIQYYLGMHRDATPLHQLGQQLAFQKALTEAVLDVAPVMVALLDSEQKVLLDNQAYKSLRGDLKGKEPARLFLEGVEQLGQGFNNREVRLDLQGRTEPRWFTVSAVQVSALDEAVKNYFQDANTTSNSLLLVANEITSSRRKTQVARMNAIRASIAEQQMKQSMNEAISGAIFQLQSPLNVIRAALAMPGGVQSDDGLRAVLGQLLESGQQALDSMQAALPGIQSEQPRPINLNEILQDVLSVNTEQLLAAGVTVDWQPALVLPSFSGRPNALRSLFSYLLDNALQALNLSDQAHREIRIITREQNGWLEVDLFDNGPGIKPAQQFKVFEPFFRGWEQGQGHAGMGLTMAQELVMQHRGYLDIKSSLNNGWGCRVRVSLPLSDASGGIT